MNKRKKIEERELRRNGEGYYDPTAYEAIKKADAELEGKKDSKKKEKKQRQYYVGPREEKTTMTLKQYKKWKLRILDELCVNMTEGEKAYLNALPTEAEVDAYAHRLIMRKD